MGSLALDAPIEVHFADGRRLALRIDGDPMRWPDIEDTIVDAIIACSGGEEDLVEELTRMATDAGLAVVPSGSDPCSLVIR